MSERRMDPCDVHFQLVDKLPSDVEVLTSMHKGIVRFRLSQKIQGNPFNLEMAIPVKYFDVPGYGEHLLSKILFDWQQALDHALLTVLEKNQR